MSSSEHAHLYTGYSDINIPHVSLEKHVEEIAAHSVRNIPGASEVGSEYFNKDAIRAELPQPKHINQHLHLGWWFSC